MSEEEIKVDINSGFIAPPTIKGNPKQWFGGGVVSIPYFVRKEGGDWEEITITTEQQNFKVFDSMACVSNSLSNSNDKQIEYLRHKEIYITAELSNWLATKGIILPNGIYTIDEEKIKPWIDENGKFNSSNRFLAKSSKTSTAGNTPMNVGDALLDFGLPPESVWSIKEFINNGFNWTEFYKEPSNDVKEWGKRFKELFYTPYERLPDSKQSTIDKYLKRAPLWWATATCSGWNTSDIVKTCSASPNHMTLGQGLKQSEYLKDYDSYDPFNKKLAWDYKIYYPYQMVVFPKLEVLKKKEGEEPTMKIELNVVKKKGTPDFLYEDNMRKGVWHRYGDPDTYKSQCGEFPQTPDELDIANESIESPIYLAPSIWKVLALALGDFFSKLRGK